MSVGQKLSIPFVGLAGVLAAQAVRTSRSIPILQAPPGRPMTFGSQDSPEITLAVIGDSSAVGVGATSLEDTYPWICGELIGQYFRVNVWVFGRSGARMAEAARKFGPQAAVVEPDVTLVGMGANDVTHFTPIRAYLRQLTDVVETVGATGSEVIVKGTPRFDSPALPHPLKGLIKARTRQVTEAMKRFCEARGLVFLHPKDYFGDAFALDHSLFSPDRFHPGDSGYRLWGENLAGPVLQAATEVVASRRR